jgi:hypothetical protein
MYVTGSDAWNSQKSDVGGQESGGESPREVRQGLPEPARGGNQGRGCFGLKNGHFADEHPEPFAYFPAAPIFGS